MPAQILVKELDNLVTININHEWSLVSIYSDPLFACSKIMFRGGGAQITAQVG